MILKRLIFCLFISLYFLALDAQTEERIHVPFTTIGTIELIQRLNIKDDTLRLFNFWATWCKPCVAEMPFLEETYKLYRSEAFMLYLVSLDFPELAEAKLSPFIQKNNITAPVLLMDVKNPNEWIDLVEPLWSGAIPFSLISYKGKKCFAENQFESVQEIESYIENCKISQP
jgi:thiol-disulfide isomerase/thioredoxin